MSLKRVDHSQTASHLTSLYVALAAPSVYTSQPLRPHFLPVRAQYTPGLSLSARTLQAACPSCRRHGLGGTPLAPSSQHAVFRFELRCIPRSTSLGRRMSCVRGRLFARRTSRTDLSVTQSSL
ncbi:hypothetical protein BV20DRAFT_968439 [Pilatotrama ljubarskyi]|nr:hypothetical protein BV20DRAFT_968439 [Pilatotrama ljubarskyi]